jgi:hypothetical protein
VVFGVGDDLDVTVSANTASFTTGMSRAEGATEELRRDLRRLGFVTDRAESNLDSAGRSATTTAGQFGILTGATNTTNTAFLGLSATTLTALVPAIFTLGAALTPVIAALGGLVTIGAAIGGIGLLGAIGGIATNTEMLKEQFMGMVDVLESEFAPVFDLAADLLVLFINEFERIIPQLVPAEDSLSRIAAAFAELGVAVIDMLPAFMELAVALAEEFLPPFVDFVQEILPEAPDMIRTLVGAARDLLPMFMDFGRSVGRLLPELMEFGMVALPIIADALGELNGFIIDALSFVNGLEQAFTDLVAGGSLILPFLAGLVSLLGGPVTLALAGLVGAVIGLATAFRDNFANIRGYLTGLWNEVQSVIPDIRGAIDAFLSGVDFEELTNAVGNFEDALGNQLMQTLEDLGPVFDNFQDFLADNEEEFALLGDAAGEFLTSLINIATTLVNVVFPAVRKFLVPALQFVIDAADRAIGAVGTLIELFQEVRAGDFQGAGEVLAESEELAAFTDLTSRRDISQQEFQRVVENQVEVIIEGELPEESIKSVAANEIDNTNRRSRRNQGRRANPN